MTCLTAARLADRRMHLMAFESPAFFRSRRAEATAGPAQDALPTPRDCFKLHLQAQRLTLLREAERLRNLRRNKAASICEADLRDVTTMLLEMESAQES